MESPYDVLGVDPDADYSEIERAFRRRVKETHPDQGGSVREFQAVMAAYEQVRSGGTVDPDADGRGPDAGEPTPETGQRPWTASQRDSGGPGNGARTGSGSGEGSESRSDRSRVEYLDFECLDDHGWSIDDADLFEKAADAGLNGSDYGRLCVDGDESLLEAAEDDGYEWPFACRGGACANCAVAVTRGDLSQPVDHILPEEMVERGIRLSCVGTPTTDDTRVVYNVKHLPDLDDLRLPPRPFE